LLAAVRGEEHCVSNHEQHLSPPHCERFAGSRSW
jgi:hypothetical protein